MNELSQQINLYQTPSTAARVPLSATTTLRLLGIVGLVLVAFWGFSAWQVFKLKAGVETVRLQRNAIESLEAAGMRELEALSQEDLELHVAALNATLATKSRALEMVRAEREHPATSFSRRLEGLARNHVQGIWLSHLTFGSTARELRLVGTTTDPTLVPAYLHELAKDPALRGALIDDFIIAKPPSESMQAESKQAAALKFWASSRALTPTKAEDPS
jgi:hypothetical protein